MHNSEPSKLVSARKCFISNVSSLYIRWLFCFKRCCPVYRLDIQSYAEDCIRVDIENDRQNFREIFEKKTYLRHHYIANGSKVPLPFTADAFQGAVVLDCGAYVGMFAMFALMHGAKKVICVEPNPNSYEQLEHNLAPFTNRVVLHQVPPTQQYRKQPSHPPNCLLTG
eukprot:COSAG01_NODE_5315_length_4341_cov_4.952145_1_plen_168_part_00